MNNTDVATKLKPNWLAIGTFIFLVVVGIAQSQSWLLGEISDSSKLSNVPIGLYGIFACIAIFNLRNHCWKEIRAPKPLA